MMKIKIKNFKMLIKKETTIINRNITIRMEINNKMKIIMINMKPILSRLRKEELILRLRKIIKKINKKPIMLFIKIWKKILDTSILNIRRIMIKRNNQE